MSNFSGALPGAVGPATATAEIKATRAAWYMLFTLCAVTLLRWVDHVVLVVGTEPMRKALELSDTQIGMLQGLGISLAAAFAAVPLAWLADRFDRRKVLAICVFAWSAATMWRAYVQTFGQVMASTVGMAIADAALVPVAYALLPLFFQGRQLARVNLIYYAVTALGFSLAMMFSGVLFKALHDFAHLMPLALQGMEPWRLASFLVGIIGPVFCLMVLRIDALGGRRLDPPPSADARGPDHGHAITLRDYWRKCWRGLLGIYGSGILMALGLAPLSAWLAPAVARRFHIDPATVGGEVGALYLSSSVAGMLGAWLLQKLLGRRHGMLVSLHSAPWLTALSGIPLAALALLDTRMAMYASACLCMVLLIAYNAGMPTIFQKMVPAALRARVLAIAISISAATAAAGPILVGYISDQIRSDNALFLAIAALGLPGALAAGALLWWCRPHVVAAIAYSEAADATLPPIT